MRTSKVSVSREDISNFPITEMRIDPYWSDLYNPSTYRRYVR